MRERHDNDNETETMFPIGLAALEILNRLRTKMQIRDLENEQSTQDGARNDSPTKQAHEKEKERFRYLEHRVRNLKEFERLAKAEGDNALRAELRCCTVPPVRCESRVVYLPRMRSGFSSAHSKLDGLSNDRSQQCADWNPEAENEKDDDMSHAAVS